MCDSTNRDFRESGMLLLSAPTVTSARKCAYNCYLKLIFQSCSSQKIFIYLKLLHPILLDNFNAWKKSGSSIEHVLCLKQQKKNNSNQSGCSKTQTQKRRLSFSADQGSDGLIPAGMPQFRPEEIACSVFSCLCLFTLWHVSCGFHDAASLRQSNTCQSPPPKCPVSDLDTQSSNAPYSVH